MKKILVFFLATFFIFFLTASASAHQPRLVYNLDLSSTTPLAITNANVSQAFYGQLRGQPEFFQLQFSQPLDFYFQILTPDLPDSQENISVELSQIEPESNGFRPLLLDGSDANWVPFYEDYAGDNYWQGPDKQITLEPGTYLLRVSSPDNTGKYVLVVGQEESFPPDEALKTILNMPALKAYFNKPVWTIFQGKIGHYLGAGILGLVVIIILFVLVLKRR